MEVFIKSRASLCGFDSDKQEDRQTGTKALSAALDRRTSPPDFAKYRKASQPTIVPSTSHFSPPFPPIGPPPQQAPLFTQHYVCPPTSILKAKRHHRPTVTAFPVPTTLQCRPRTQISKHDCGGLNSSSAAEFPSADMEQPRGCEDGTFLVSSLFFFLLLLAGVGMAERGVFFFAIVAYKNLFVKPNLRAPVMKVKYLLLLNSTHLHKREKHCV